jgi:GAF domain-containing protein
MSDQISFDVFSGLMDLSESVMSAKGLDNLADEVMPGVASFSGMDAVFLYIATPQLFTPRFYKKNIPSDEIPRLKSVCAAQLDRLTSLPPSATTPRSWKADANFTVYPLRDGYEYTGFLGIALNGNGLPVSSKLWDRFLQVLGSTTHRLAERRKIERQLAHLNTYLTVSSMLAQSLGLSDMLETALYCCMEVASAEAATVLLLDDEKANFLFYQVEGPTKPVLMSATFPADQGIAGAVYHSGISEVINDCPNDPRFYGKIDEESGYQTRNMIALPLIAGEEPVGVLEVLNKTDEQDFTEEEHLSLMMIAEEVAFAVRNAKIFEYVVDSYCKQRQGLNTCAGCKRPLGSWTPCVKYRETII